MFDHRVAGDNVTLIKSPYYYNREDVYLDKIVFKPMPVAAAAAAALEAGDIQVLDQVSPTELPGVQAELEPAGVSCTQLGWRGDPDQHRQPERRSATCPTRTSARRSRRARSCGRRSRRRSTGRR